MTDHILERPPKILILGEAAAIHTRRWAGHFRNMGWTVRWLSFAPIEEGVAAERIPQQTDRRALAILNARIHVRTVIDQFRPDVISALFLPDYGWLACLTKRHPVAISAWGSDVLLAPQKSFLHRWRISYVLKRADWLFCDARFLQTRMIELGAKPEIIRTVPLGVTDDWLNLAAKQEDRGNRPLCVITNRRLEPLYRVDTFIRAIHAIDAQRRGAFHFTVIGDGSQRSTLEALASELGLRDQVEFTGMLSEEQLQQRMASADIFVSCSSSDGTSVSLLEAMAAGAFPIVTDLPANREWITEGQNGQMFPVGDHSRLAAEMMSALQNYELRMKARTKNHGHIAQRARWTDNMAMVEEDLLTLIARHSDRHKPPQQPR